MKTKVNHRDVNKYFFSLRVIKKWDNPNSEVVEEKYKHSFKKRYDKVLVARRGKIQ